MQIDFKRCSLENGLRLLVSKQSRVPLVSLNAFVRAGSDQNPMDWPGLATLTSRMLDEGTVNYRAEEIAEAVENVGGNLATFSNRELSGISLHLRSEDLPLGLQLLQEMLCHPTFPKDRFEREKSRILTRLEAMRDDPQIVGVNRLNQWIYEGTPFQVPTLGVEESVRRLTENHVEAFHRQKYAPENTILVIVGAVGVKDSVERVSEYFLDWRNSDFEPSSSLSFKRRSAPVKDEIRMEKEQLTIFLGHLGVSRDCPDFYALQVMDVILGSGPGFTSRIPRTLREDQGLAYSTYCDISSSSGVYPGRFVAFISTSPENKRRALLGLVSEIEGLLEKGVSESELTMAQDFLTGNFVFEFQSNASIARFLLSTELFQLGTDYPERYPRIIRSIDCREVNRVAHRYLDTVNCTTVIVGPR